MADKVGDGFDDAGTGEPQLPLAQRVEESGMEYVVS